MHTVEMIPLAAPYEAVLLEHRHDFERDLILVDER